MYRTKEPAVQKFLIAQINRPMPPSTQTLLGEHALQTAEAIWNAAYDQALQDTKQGPYAEKDA